MQLVILKETFSICKVRDKKDINFDGDFLFLGKTEEELSVVCDREHLPSNCICQEDGFRAFRIQGVLDFSLIGILAAITKVLAEHKIGVFVVSTYNTDYILVKEENFHLAQKALSQAGYGIQEIGNL